MQNQNNTKSAFGGFFPRLAAYLIDIILVGTALIILRLPMGIITLINPNNPLTTPVLFQFSTWDILLYLLGVTYFVTMTYFSGRTIGKRLLCLKIVSTSDVKLTFLSVLYRETIGRYLSSLMFLGYLLICVDQEKRGLHDILCDTRVVYTNTIALIEVPNAFSTSQQNGGEHITFENPNTNKEL